MGLERELAYFNQIRESLLASHEGKYAVICGEVLAGTFDSVENAYNAGLKAFGKEQFLVQKVTRTDQVFANHALSHGLINANLWPSLSKS